MKLTKAQREVLEKMRDGWKFTFMKGRDPHVFMSHRTLPQHIRPRTSTMFALKAGGMIEEAKDDWRFTDYRITDAGRAALAAAATKK